MVGSGRSCDTASALSVENHGLSAVSEIIRIIIK